MRFSDDTIERVNAVPIGDVMADLGFTPNRGGFARCPFHDEKSASLHVFKQKNGFHCFGCGASGDVLGLVMKFLDIKFTEAVSWVADRFSIIIEEDTRKPPPRLRREIAPEVTKLASVEAPTEFHLPVDMYSRYEQIPQYAIDRGLSYAACKAFRIGHDPEMLRMLTPVFDVDGFLRGVSGRLYAPGCLRCDSPLAPHETCRRCGYRQPPKWLHSDGFDRSQYLFGEDKIDKTCNECVVVEGPLDVMALWQIGIRNVLATFGAVPSPAQVMKVVDWFDAIIVCGDGDNAGSKMAETWQTFVGRRMKVAVAKLPPKTDPLSAGPVAAAFFVQEARKNLAYRPNHAII